MSAGDGVVQPGNRRGIPYHSPEAAAWGPAPKTVVPPREREYPNTPGAGLGRESLGPESATPEATSRPGADGPATAPDSAASSGLGSSRGSAPDTAVTVRPSSAGAAQAPAPLASRRVIKASASASGLHMLLAAVGTTDDGLAGSRSASRPSPPPALLPGRVVADGPSWAAAPPAGPLPAAAQLPLPKISPPVLLRGGELASAPGTPAEAPPGAMAHPTAFSHGSAATVGRSTRLPWCDVGGGVLAARAIVIRRAGYPDEVVSEAMLVPMLGAAAAKAVHGRAGPMPTPGRPSRGAGGARRGGRGEAVAPAGRHGIVFAGSAAGAAHGDGSTSPGDAAGAAPGRGDDGADEDDAADEDYGYTGSRRRWAGPEGRAAAPKRRTARAAALAARAVAGSEGAEAGEDGYADAAPYGSSRDGASPAAERTGGPHGRRPAKRARSPSAKTDTSAGTPAGGTARAGGRARTGEYITSRYRGVYGRSSAKANGVRWAAHASDGKRKVHLGYFNTEEDAARAYDEAVRRFKGPNAITNFG